MKIYVTAVMPNCQHLLQPANLLQLTRFKVVYKISPHPSLLLPLPHLLCLRQPRRFWKSLLLPLPKLLRLCRLLKMRGLFLPIWRSRIRRRRIDVTAVMLTRLQILHLTRRKVVGKVTCLMLLLQHRRLFCIFKSLRRWACR